MYSIVILFPGSISISPRYQLSTDSKSCMQLGTPILMPTARTPFIGRLYFIHQSIGHIISFQMMPPLRSFDGLDGKERGQKKTDNLRTMTTLGPRTLVDRLSLRVTTPSRAYIRASPGSGNILDRSTIRISQ